MTISRTSLPALGALVLSLLLALPAFALELGDAKTRGLVGETATGYLAVVQPSAEAQALVETINARRKVHYQKIADKNKISLQAVEVRAGQKAIGKTPAGQFVNPGSGWEKK